MVTSKTIYTFKLSREQGHVLLTAQEYPWSVLQVVQTTPETFDKDLTKCKKEWGGTIAIHDTDRTFFVIHLCSGDQGGKYPERHIVSDSMETIRLYLDSLRDAMAQAAVWYYTNVIMRARNL